MEASTGRWMLTRGRIISRTQFRAVGALGLEVRLRRFWRSEFDPGAGAKFLNSLDYDEFSALKAAGDFDLAR
jgi:hypothetical protein